MHQMITNQILRWLWLVALTASCGIDTADHLRESNIYDGKPDLGHPSVGVLILDKTTQSHCTASLVGKRTALTAAHCVKGYPDTSKVELRLDGATYNVETVVPHPGYQEQGNTFDAVSSNDIAVLRLQQAPPISPTPIVNATTPPQLGQKITLVGYGVTDYGKSDAMVKRMAEATIDVVKTGYIGYGGYTSGEGAHRPGDSGGPTFSGTGAQEVQIGVHSMGDKATGFVVDCRVDNHVQWIQQQSGGDVVVAGGGNFGEQPFTWTRGYGETCTDHTECVTRLCGSVNGGQARCVFTCSSDLFCTPFSRCHAGQVYYKGVYLGICWPP
jgi:secreted trypsin-like serine protease